MKHPSRQHKEGSGPVPLFFTSSRKKPSRSALRMRGAPRLALLTAPMASTRGRSPPQEPAQLQLQRLGTSFADTGPALKGFSQAETTRKVSGGGVSDLHNFRSDRELLQDCLDPSRRQRPPARQSRASQNMTADHRFGIYRLLQNSLSCG